MAASIEKLKVDYRREGSGNYPGLVLSRHSSLTAIGTAYHKKDQTTLSAVRTDNKVATDLGVMGGE